MAHAPIMGALSIGRTNICGIKTLHRCSKSYCIVFEELTANLLPNRTSYHHNPNSYNFPNFVKKVIMSLTYTGKDTLREIVGIVEEMPDAVQKRLLRHIKLEKAKLLGKEISKEQKKVKAKVSDDEIAEMIHQYRKKKNPKW